MRLRIKAFAKIVSQTLPINEPIYEFGAFQVPGQEGFADLRPFFSNKEYIGCDMLQGPGVDKIINLHNIDLPDESVGMALVLDTLEHVEYPRKAMEEIFRVLKPNGFVVISSHMNFPIHDYPHDYWRFTPQGFESLLQIFPKRMADWAGEEIFPHTVIGAGFKDPNMNINEFIKEIDLWRKGKEYLTEAEKKLPS